MSEKAADTGNRSLESWGVIAAFLVMVVSNVLATSSKIFNNTDNAKIAKENPTFISPDGLTFSVWGFIYLFEAGLTIYQALPFARSDKILAKSRKYIIASFLLNAVWLPIFQFNLWWLSFAVIIAYLFALHRTYQSLEVNYGGKQSWRNKVFAHTGISLNFSWVLVATLLNANIVFRQSAIMYTDVTDQVTNATSGFLPGAAIATARIGGNPDFAILCVVVAATVALYRAAKTRDVPYTFVAAWALGGIYRMQKFAADDDFPTVAKSRDVQRWAVVAMAVVAVGAAVALCLAIVDVRRSSAADSTNSSTQPLCKMDAGGKSPQV